MLPTIINTSQRQQRRRRNTHRSIQKGSDFYRTKVTKGGNYNYVGLIVTVMQYNRNLLLLPFTRPNSILSITGRVQTGDTACWFMYVSTIL
jgi:hypothetical protein